MVKLPLFSSPICRKNLPFLLLASSHNDRAFHATKSTLTPPPTHHNDEPTRAEQRRSDWGIIKRLLGNVWPRNDWKTRGTVLFGFGLLVSGKVRVYLGYDITSGGALVLLRRGPRVLFLSRLSYLASICEKNRAKMTQ